MHDIKGKKHTKYYRAHRGSLLENDWQTDDGFKLDKTIWPREHTVKASLRAWEEVCVLEGPEAYAPLDS